MRRGGGARMSPGAVAARAGGCRADARAMLARRGRRGAGEPPVPRRLLRGRPARAAKQPGERDRPAARSTGSPTIDPNNGYISQALTHRAMLDWVHLKGPGGTRTRGPARRWPETCSRPRCSRSSVLTLVRNGQIYERMLLEIIAGLSTYLLLRRLAPEPPGRGAGGHRVRPQRDVRVVLARRDEPGRLPAAPAPRRRDRLRRERRRTPGRLVVDRGCRRAVVLRGLPGGRLPRRPARRAWFVWRCAASTGRGCARVWARSPPGPSSGALLAGPLLVASIHFLGQSEFSGATTKRFGDQHLPLSALPQLLLPYVHGPIFGDGRTPVRGQRIWSGVGGFLSTSLLLFALLGLLTAGRRGLRLPWLAWIVVAWR